MQFPEYIHPKDINTLEWICEWRRKTGLRIRFKVKTKINEVPHMRIHNTSVF